MTKPYSPAQVERTCSAVGLAVDDRLDGRDAALTMGGEPTFVVASTTWTSPQWTVAADGPEKRQLADRLAVALLAERWRRAGWSSAARASGIRASRCRAGRSA